MKNKNEECNVLHAETVNKVRKNMPLEEELIDLANLFKNFSEPTRVKILAALLEEEMCVCDIAALLNMSKSSISHQLRILKYSKLVKNKKIGKSVFYSLADDHVKAIYDQGFAHIHE